MQTITLLPVKDNTLYENDSGSTSNGSGNRLFVGNTNSRLARRAVIAFDITSNIPGGATIQSASLSMQVTRTKIPPQTIELRPLLVDWGEAASNADSKGGGSGTSAENGDATWIHSFSKNERWSSPGGDFASEPSASTLVGGNGSYAWGPTEQMTADVQTWLDNPSANFGWLLLGNEQSRQTTKRFASREDEVSSNRPALTIEFLIP